MDSILVIEQLSVLAKLELVIAMEQKLRTFCRFQKALIRASLQDFASCPSRISQLLKLPYLATSTSMERHSIC